MKFKADTTPGGALCYRSGKLAIMVLPARPDGAHGDRYEHVALLCDEPGRKAAKSGKPFQVCIAQITVLKEHDQAVAAGCIDLWLKATLGRLHTKLVDNNDRNVKIAQRLGDYLIEGSDPKLSK